MQSDTEKLQGLPVTPFMDRDKVSKPSSQTNFIRFVLLPLFSELTKLFPCLEVRSVTTLFSLAALLSAFQQMYASIHMQQHILEPVRHALEYYSELERASRDTASGDKPLERKEDV